MTLASLEDGTRGALAQTIEFAIVADNASLLVHYMVGEWLLREPRARRASKTGLLDGQTIFGYREVPALSHTTPHLSALVRV
jgi:hypothetical protein